MKAFVLYIFYFIAFGNGYKILDVSGQIARYYVDRVLDEVNNQSECTRQLKILTGDLNKMQTWALQMFDSSARLDPGLLDGHAIFVGNYHECLEINVNRNCTQIKGQYCRALMTPNRATAQCVAEKFHRRGIFGLGNTPLSDLDPMIQLRYDVCLPAACTSDYLQKSWNLIEKRYGINVHLEFAESLCSTVEKRNQFYLIEIVAISVFVIIGVVIVFCTLYDVLVLQKQKGRKYKWLVAFSFYTNGKHLFTLKDNKDDTFTCLHGIRVITLAWIALGHRAVTLYYKTAVNSIKFIEWFTVDSNMFVTGSAASVDTFFVISGFLIVYHVMSAKQKGHKVSILQFYIHRLLRLSPSLGGIILLHVGIVRHVGEGPYWNIAEDFLVRNCYKNWWTTFLFVQNYVRPNPLQTCITQGWYLSADTQLYFLSPLLFLPLLKWPKQTVVLVIGLILASIAATMHATIYYKLDQRSLQAVTDFSSYVYMQTHLRAGPWLVGILFGYFMFKTRNKEMLIKKPTVFILWILSLAIMLLFMYCCIAFLRFNLPIALIAVFTSLSRPIWGLCICWIIFACSRGYGGFINKFLSLPIFNLLSRFTLSFFLSHLLIGTIVNGQRGSAPYFSNLSTFHEMWGDYAFTLAFSLVWTLVFESPIISLERMFKRQEINKHSDVKENYYFKGINGTGY